MRLTDSDTRSLLAAEYVVGTLQGGARRRFELWLRSDPGLRREVSQWQARFEPLAASIPEVQPSARVWEQIEARIQPAAPSPLPNAAGARSWWSSLAFWRLSSLGTGALAAALVAYVLALPGDQVPDPAGAMVVVMADTGDSSPKMTVAWAPEPVRQPRLRIRVIGHQEMAPDTAWELWMLPGGNQPPRSLGLITTHETQHVEIPADMMSRLNGAEGMAMSVEPKGGSPTGLPTGPVLYSGRCVKI